MMPGGPAPPPAPGTLTEQRYYSAKDLANLARGVGWRDDQPSNDPTRASELAVAVAIALAESGGDRMAYNPSPAYGLWQIHPGDPSLFEAHANAQAAWGKYVGAGKRFTPWTTFTSRAYLVKLPAAEIAVRGTHRDRPGFTGGGTGAVHDLIDFTGNIGHDLAAFFGWITSGQTWIRLGEVIAGAILAIAALILLFHGSEAGKKLQSKAETGAKLAAVA